MKPESAYRIDRIKIDPEFASLTAPPNPDELALLETAIRRDGLREMLTVWSDHGTVLLIDGHTRLKIVQEIGYEEVPVTFAKLPDRDAALLWIEENQAGRRNLTDDQRAMIWASILERRAKASHETKLEQARQTKSAPASMEVKTTSIEKIDSAADMAEALAPKQRARAEVAKESGLPESKLRAAAKLKKEDPEAAKQVRAGTKTIRQAKKGRRAKKESAGKFVENVK